MLLMRTALDPFLLFVASYGLAVAAMTAAQIKRPFQGKEAFADAFTLHCLTAGPALIFSGTVLNDPGAAFVAAGIAIAVGEVVRRLMPSLTVLGAAQLALPWLAWIVGGPWSYLMLAEAGMPDAALALTLVGIAVAPFALTFATLDTLARRAVFTHARWRRPTRPNAVRLVGPSAFAPKVSIQVPTYAEPPEIVNAVLDRLAALDYPDFEVLVCDNNTQDPALWRPVEAHCAALNRRAGMERFRFFHVAPLAGAKAGALNYLLGHMDPAAELIAVIDADYYSQPDFLSRLVPFFENARMGYVQTPHDYRDCANPYLEACYWEYMPANKVELPGLNEYAAAYTIGTMCIVRREALEKAGRWAEWCLTEDSEVSVRMRAVGYEGIYLNQTFGRGLVPDTFEDYKKQRFRWAAGPVQQLRRHWRMYLPRAIARPSHLSGWSRFLELQRGVMPVLTSAGFVLGVAGWLGAVALTHNAVLPIVELPPVFWVATFIGMLSLIVTRWHGYALSGCTSPAAMLRGELARMSLTKVQLVAALAGLSSKPMAWRRTPKFAATSTGMRAFRDVLPETLIGAGFIVVALISALSGEAIGGHLALLSFVGGLTGAAQFLAAPAMAWLSERQLAQGEAASFEAAVAPFEIEQRRAA